MSDPPAAPVAPATRFRLPGALVDSAAGLPTLLFVLLFAGLPAALLFGDALQHFGLGPGFAALLWGPSLDAAVARRALENSAVQGGLSAALAFAWGYPAGLFLGRHDFPGRRTLLGFLLVPFLLPPLVVVLGLDALFGPTGLLGGPLGVLGRGLPAILLANVFYDASVVALFTSAAVANASPRLEEAAETLGAGRWRVFRDVWGRASLLGGGAGALLTFLLAFLGFGAPLLLGGPSNYTIEVWIYSLAQTVYATPLAAAGLALWTVAVLALPSVAFLWLAQRTSLAGGRERGATRRLPIPWRRPVTAALGAVTAALVAFLVGVLAATGVLSFRLPDGAWGTANWSGLFAARTTQALGISTAGALVNSLFFAGTATLVVLGLVLLAAYRTTRPRRTLRAIEAFAFLPVILSPVILAFALRTFWGRTLGIPPLLWILIVVSQAALALPFVLQTVRTALRSHPPELRQAARTLGASPWRAFTTVDLPLLRPALLTGALFAFALGLGEFAATNFLYIPSYTTLVVEAYLLEVLRLAGPASALGAFLIVVSGVSLVLIVRGPARVRD